jgi:hypothetical protein
MFRAVLDQALGPRHPVSFVSFASLEVAAEKLHSACTTSRFKRLLSERMYGHSRVDSVYLERVTPFFANSWRPVFYGRFETQDGRTVLVGSFGLSTYTRRFMVVFIAFSLFWTAVASWATFSAAPDPEFFWFPFAGVGMAAAVIAMGRFGALLSKSDIDWISTRVESALM